MRRPRRFLSALGVTALAASLAVGVAAVSVAVPTAGAAPRVTATYAVDRPVCSAPADPHAMRCFAMRRVAASRTTAGAYPVRHVGKGPVGGFTPRQLATAYGYNPATPRPGTTVGVILWHDAPYVLRDLNVFNARNGLKRETAYTFRKVNQRGKATPLPKRDLGSATEISLDTQAVRGACNTCRILLVEADGPYDTSLAAAVNTAVRLGADVITNSYGTPERRFSTAVQRAYNHPGVAIVASTGDSGWFGWDIANDPRYYPDGGASFPSTSPYVIAVGGTTLTLNSANHRTSEIVWNDNGAHDRTGYLRGPQGASGGGCSRYFNAQPWQSHAAGYAKTYCNGKRLAADMAMVADPSSGLDIYDTGSGGWITIGGTSLSAPLAAGVIAVAGGAKGARYPSSALYGNSSVTPSRRFDVTVGGNGFCHTDTPSVCSRGSYSQWGVRNPNATDAGPVDCSFSRAGNPVVPSVSKLECTAAAGYDGPSGVGTPTSARLFSRTDPYLGVRFATPTHGRYATFTAFLRAILPGTTLRSTTWSWGDGRTLRTTSTSVKHRYAKAGRYTLTLSGYDSRYQTVVIKRTVTVR